MVTGLSLAGCTGQPAQTEPPAPLPEATKQVMEQACGAAVAEHIGAAPDAVLAVWSGATPDNRGLVTVGDRVDGIQRVHFCEVSDTGQVAAIRHSL
jgi:hypothetical protein